MFPKSTKPFVVTGNNKNYRGKSHKNTGNQDKGFFSSHHGNAKQNLNSDQYEWVIKLHNEYAAIEGMPYNANPGAYPVGSEPFLEATLKRSSKTNYCDMELLRLIAREVKNFIKIRKDNNNNISNSNNSNIISQNEVQILFNEILFKYDNLIKGDNKVMQEALFTPFTSEVNGTDSQANKNVQDSLNEQVDLNALRKHYALQCAKEATTVLCKIKFNKEYRFPAYGINKVFDKDIRIVGADVDLQYDYVRYENNEAVVLNSVQNDNGEKKGGKRKERTHNMLNLFGTALEGDIVAVKLLPTKLWVLETPRIFEIEAKNMSDVIKRNNIDIRGLYGNEAVSRTAQLKKNGLDDYFISLTKTGAREINGHQVIDCSDVVLKRDNMWDGKPTNAFQSNISSEYIHKSLKLSGLGDKSPIATEDYEEIIKKLIQFYADFYARNDDTEIDVSQGEGGRVGVSNMFQNDSNTGIYYNNNDKKGYNNINSNKQAESFDLPLPIFPTWPSDRRPTGVVIGVLHRSSRRHCPAVLETSFSFRPQKIAFHTCTTFVPFIKTMPKIKVLGIDIPNELRRTPREFLFLVNVPVYTLKDVAGGYNTESNEHGVMQRITAREVLAMSRLPLEEKDNNSPIKTRNEFCDDENEFKNEQQQQQQQNVESESNINHNVFLRILDGRPQGEVIMSLGYQGSVQSASRAILNMHEAVDTSFSEEAVKSIEDVPRVSENDIDIARYECEESKRREMCWYKEILANNSDEIDMSSVINKCSFKEPIRRDLTNEFVISIDPATARDLDDAVSVRYDVKSGNYIVGIHIADVSHYVQPGSPLDNEAMKRMTSVYMVERVVPMLDTKLSDDLCSLNTKGAKYAFSSMFEIDLNTFQVHSESFSRSIIRNRCQMSYEQAQSIIDGDYSGNTLVFSSEEICRMAANIREKEGAKQCQSRQGGGGAGSGEGNFDRKKMRDSELLKIIYTPEELKAAREKLITKVCSTVRKLYRIAVYFRNEGTRNGRMRINKPELCFNFVRQPWEVAEALRKKQEVRGLFLGQKPPCDFGKTDIERGQFLFAPSSFTVKRVKEANWTIEQLMILNNSRTAMKLLQILPRTAFIRIHHPPMRLTSALVNVRLAGYDVQGGSSTQLQESINKYKQDENYDALLMMMILSMRRARCVCSSFAESMCLPGSGVGGDALEGGGDEEDSFAEEEKTGVVNVGKGRIRGGGGGLRLKAGDPKLAELVAKATQLNVAGSNNPGTCPSPISVKDDDEDMELSAQHAALAVGDLATQLALGGTKNPLRHYGLALDYYTYFTSPIRRYADLMAHRQMLLVSEIERLYRVVKNLTIIKRKTKAGIPFSLKKDTLPCSRPGSIPKYFTPVELAPEDAPYWSVADDEAFVSSLSLAALPAEVQQYAYSAEEVEDIASCFNDKSHAARCCSEDSERYFLSMYLKIQYRMMEAAGEDEIIRFSKEHGNQFIKEEQTVDTHTRRPTGGEEVGQNGGDDDLHEKASEKTINMKNSKIAKMRKLLLTRYQRLEKKIFPPLLNNHEFLQAALKIFNARPIPEFFAKMTVIELNSKRIVFYIPAFCIIERVDVSGVTNKNSQMEAAILGPMGAQKDALRGGSGGGCANTNKRRGDSVPKGDNKIQEWKSTVKYNSTEGVSYINWGVLSNNNLLKNIRKNSKWGGGNNADDGKLGSDSEVFLAGEEVHGKLKGIISIAGQNNWHKDFNEKEKKIEMNVPKKDENDEVQFPEDVEPQETVSEDGDSSQSGTEERGEENEDSSTGSDCTEKYYSVDEDAPKEFAESPHEEIDKRKLKGGGGVRKTVKNDLLMRDLNTNTVVERIKLFSNLVGRVTFDPLNFVVVPPWERDFEKCKFLEEVGKVSDIVQEETEEL